MSGFFLTKMMKYP